MDINSTGCHCACYHRFTFQNKNNAKIAGANLVGCSFAYSKGYGLNGIRNSFFTSGHAEFTKFAARHPNILEAALDYEKFTKDERYDYIPGKPPGTLIFYILNEKIANFGKGEIRSEEGADNLAEFASITWPFLTYLVLIPLYVVARSLYDDTVAIMACLLYLPIPSINLITAHTDQALYPLAATLPIFFITLAFQKKSVWYACVSGIAFYIAVYFSFGLAVIIFFYPLPLIMKIGPNWHKDIWGSAKLFGATALSMAVCDLLARKLLNYDILLRYTNAIRHHAAWRSWENNLSTLFSSSVTNLTEFSVFIGIPLSILLAAATIHALYQLAAMRIINTSSLFPTLLFGVFCFLLMFGKTKAETARLWMFLIPSICIVVAKFINTLSVNSRNQRLLLLVVFLEFTTTYLTLRYQDFQ